MYSISIFANQSPHFGASFFSFVGSPQTTYEVIKTQIYSQFQIYETQYTLNIRGRYNDIINGRFECLFLPVNCEDEWRHFFHETFETRGSQVMELHVDFNPVSGPGPDLNMVPLDEPSSSHGQSYGSNTGGTFIDSLFSYNEARPTLDLFGGDGSLQSYPRPSSSSTGGLPYYYCSDQSGSGVYQNYGSMSFSTDQPGSSGGAVQEYDVNAHNPALSPVVENDESDDDDDFEVNEGDDEGPSSHSDLSTGEEYTDVEDLSETDCPIYRRSDTLFGSGRTDTQHPVSALCDFSLFEKVGAVEKKLGPTGELGVGRVFRSKKQLGLAVCDFGCKNNIEMRTKASNKEKLIMICVQRNCAWRLYARPEHHCTNWKIVTNPTEHTCTRPPGEEGHNNLTVNLIAQCVRDELKKNISLTVSNIGALIRTRYPLVHATYNKLWRGRERAIEQLFGSWEGSYNTLPRLLEAIKKSTPGTKYTIVTWPTNDENVRVFKLAAWAYGPCIEAAQYLRPVITIDAGFLSGRYKGRLFMACGYDPENRVLPLAFGLAEKEEIVSWGWFMSWVRQEVIGYNKKICVVSDRHKAIKAVFQMVEYGWNSIGTNPSAVHRYCMQHVAENLYKEAGGQHDRHLKDDFKCRLANKKKPRRFREKWTALRESNPKACEYLKKVGKINETDPNERVNFAKWAQSFDRGHRWGIMTSNGSESLNSVFRVERRLPIAAIVEGTWYKCAGWFNIRKQEALRRESLQERWPQTIQDKLNKHDRKSAYMTVEVLGLDRGEFEVQVPGERQDGGGYQAFKYTVTIPRGLEPADHQLPFARATCDCQKPQLTGIACSHLIAVCRKARYRVDDYVDTRYSTWNFKMIWSGQFHSYGDEDTWPVYNGPKIVPDKSLVNRGRRKIIRDGMVMDRMEGRKKKAKSTRPTNNRGQASTSEVPQPRAPYPMEDLQSGRRTSRPPSRNISRRSRETVQPSRLSLNVDPRSTSNREEATIQPRRSSISSDPRNINADSGGIRAESARFSAGHRGVASTHGEGSERGIGASVRKFFTRGRKKK